MEDYRRDPNLPRVVKAARAAQPGPVEVLIATTNAARLEAMEPPYDAGALLRAARSVRWYATVAVLRRRVTGGYLMTVPGHDGEDKELDRKSVV